MRIIGKKSLQYAKNMYVFRDSAKYNDDDHSEETLIKRSEDKQHNLVREQLQRKEVHAYLEKIMDLMEENFESEYNKEPLTITFIFER